VIGRDIDLALLTLAADRPLDDCLDDLEPAVVQRLLVIDPAQPSVLRFSHALVREVLEAGITSLRRARIHLRVLMLEHGELDDRRDPRRHPGPRIVGPASARPGAPGGADVAAALQRSAEDMLRAVSCGTPRRRSKR
jgi:hypothetical protein